MTRRFHGPAIVATIATVAASFVGAMAFVFARRRAGRNRGPNLMPCVEAFDAFGTLVTPWYRQVARDIAARQPGGDGLEVGGGGGHLAVQLVRLAPDLRLTTTDVDPAMVERARRRVERAGLSDRLRVRQADVSALPYPDASFDVVVSLSSMHHWPDQVAGLAEIHRVLRPGGRAIVYDFADAIRRFERGGPGPAELARESPFVGGTLETFRWPWRIPLQVRLELRRAATPAPPESAPAASGPASTTTPVPSAPMADPRPPAPPPAAAPPEPGPAGAVPNVPPEPPPAPAASVGGRGERDRRHVRAYVGLGANVGDTRATLTAAVRALGALPGVRIRSVSSLYRTRPVGPADQPDFANAVVGLDVPAGPDPRTGALALLASLKLLERSLGRRERERWGPREIDLDLLLFGRAALHVARPDAARSMDPARTGVQWLELPHPEAHNRLFVLAPLAELAPGLRPPGWGETVASARRRHQAVEGDLAVRRVARWQEGEGWIDL